MNGTFQQIESLFSPEFSSGLERLGFNNELGKSLFFVSDIDKYALDYNLWFILDKARLFDADAVCCRRMIGGKFVPQVYLYDFTKNELFDSSALTEIHKKIWTSSEVPLVCIFTKLEIKILDTTSPIDRENETPAYLDEILLAGEINRIFNQQFANSITSGTYWDDEEIKRNLSFNRNSSYCLLIEYLKKVIKNINEGTDKKKQKLVQKLIVQSILVKYLEEREDNSGNKVFPSNFFNEYSNATCFCDILRNGSLFHFFDDLNKDHFNGKVFEWSEDEKIALKENDFSDLAGALSGESDINGQLSIWRLYSFNYIPVELISRLYEEFIDDEEKSENGATYTPSHLAKFLVDEIMPIEHPQDLRNFKILDPACGSGIFLVIAFKRIIQWWRIQNEYKNPTLSDLKSILNSSIFGIDLNSTSTQLTAFSLCVALCDELTPKQIWNELSFDDLTKKNISNNDFFNWLNDDNNKKGTFDIIIGNPPFVRGGISSNLGTWTINEQRTVNIPQNQIALKFLSESISLLKYHAKLCLIIKASGLLYNSTSLAYKQALFSHYNVNQILDFSPLARNKSLWDSDTDVAAAAIFLTNENPDLKKNILHAIFRRTKITKERIFFEIDDYDLHYISRYEASCNPYIFKINLMGGGRINSLIKKCLEFERLDSYLKKNNCENGEGFIIGKNGKLSKEFIYYMPYLPTKSFESEIVRQADFEYIAKDTLFVKIPDERMFKSPNILIKENIGEYEIPIIFNRKSDFSFKDKIISIYSLEDNVDVLNRIYQSFKNNCELYRFFTFTTSSQLLINMNSAILKEDIMRLPLIDRPFNLTEIETNVILDVIIHAQEFHRRGDNSKMLNPFSKNDDSSIKKYGLEFSRILNNFYAENGYSFRLSDIIKFEDNKFLGAVFSYDELSGIEPKCILSDYSKTISELSDFKISEHLNSTRIIRYYSKNKVLFVKPNQKRYWLNSIAYRDADKTFADIINVF